METVLVQINNSKACKLLEDLEDLNIITLLERSEKLQVELAEIYAGKLTSDVASELKDYVAKGRNEWEHRIIKNRKSIIKLLK